MSWLSIALLLTTLLFTFDIEVVLWIAAVSIVACIIVYIAVLIWVKLTINPPVKGTVAFFHPFADGGGGGERVLWAAIQSLQKSYPDTQIILYCGPDSTPTSLCQHAASTFNLKIAPTFDIIPLPSRDLLDPRNYPRFTMFAQAVASIRVAVEALKQFTPDVWIDTTGWAFPYPICRLAGVHVAAYVHYPTISTDMLEGVREGRTGVNNELAIAASPFKSMVKLIYYQGFALLYGAVGWCAEVVMVNSSWTCAHIHQLWHMHKQPTVVFPPCDTAALVALPLDRKLKRLYIVSIAQFRPEKNHELQLQAYAAARAKALHHHDGDVVNAVLSSKLQFIGGCRGPEDEARLDALKARVQELGLEDSVQFKVNASFTELRALLGDAAIGLHTMREEHFGISIVEYMAAGVVPIVHDSGGPKEDIVVPEISPEGGLQLTGYRCSTVAQYREALIEALGMDQTRRLKIAAAARQRALTFSDERFQTEFIACIGKLIVDPTRGEGRGR